MELSIYIQAFIVLFIVFDAVGSIPMFHAFTGSLKAPERRRVVRRSVAAAGGILVFFALFGHFLFRFIGISINDFRVAAGAILFMLAVELVMGRLEPSLIKMKADEVAIVPLATPLLAGPGSISTVMYLMIPPFGPMPALISIAANVAVAYIIFQSSSKVISTLGINGVKVFTRIMGLIIAAFAVTLIREGIAGIIAGLKP